ncbi:MAG: type II secretion system protein [Phycisphaerae bacterium]|nr:type II secretion system protein [Phycisphaerae bacterium]MDD5381259.1 type II secretion system protein [Phycisphaerae bacterium]
MEKNIRLSYVEVMVVAIVLGIAGKMISPQFTEASNEEAKISGLVDGLEAMRIQIDLYRVQHEDILPPADSYKSFETAMTTTVGEHGPYVERIPTNPFNGLKTIRFDGEPAGAGEAGWRLDTKTGMFQADNDAACAAL